MYIQYKHYSQILKPLFQPTICAVSVSSVHIEANKPKLRSAKSSQKQKTPQLNTVQNNRGYKQKEKKTKILKL